MVKLHVKRIYLAPAASDGFRVLVDRLWPRGVSKDKADIDLWFKEIAPSTEARKDFGHVPAKFAEFTKRYRAELDNNPEAVAEALDLLRQNDQVTLLIGAKDAEHNHGLVLREYLMQALKHAGTDEISG